MRARTFFLRVAGYMLFAAAIGYWLTGDVWRTVAFVGFWSLVLLYFFGFIMDLLAIPRRQVPVPKSDAEEQKGAT